MPARPVSLSVRRLAAKVVVATMLASALGCDMDYGELFAADAGSGGGGGAAGHGGATLCGNCAPPLFCDPVAGCVQCTAADDCHEPAAPYCVNHQCVECEHNQQCPSGSRCHTAVYRCAPTCDVNSDCEGAGLGVATLCSDTNLCVQCESATDCSTAFCEPERGVCVDCSTASDCPAERPLCHVQDGRCVECLVATDCAGGGPCIDNACP